MDRDRGTWQPRDSSVDPEVDRRQIWQWIRRHLRQYVRHYLRYHDHCPPHRHHHHHRHSRLQVDRAYLRSGIRPLRYAEAHVPPSPYMSPFAVTPAENRLLRLENQLLRAERDDLRAELRSLDAQAAEARSSVHDSDEQQGSASQNRSVNYAIAPVGEPTKSSCRQSSLSSSSAAAVPKIDVTIQHRVPGAHGNLVDVVA